MPNQFYVSTIVDESGQLSLEIGSFPDRYLEQERIDSPIDLALALGQRRLRLQERGEFDQSYLRSLLLTMVLRPEYLEQIDGGLDVALSVSTEIPQSRARGFVEYALTSPVVPVEASWPENKNLVEIALGGGGVGLGLLIATGLLPPVALLTVPGGMLAVSVGRRISRRAGRTVDSPTEQLRRWRRALHEGLIDEDEYRAIVNQVIGEDIGTIPLR